MFQQKVCQKVGIKAVLRENLMLDSSVCFILEGKIEHS